MLKRVKYRDRKQGSGQKTQDGLTEAEEWEMMCGSKGDELWQETHWE